MANQDASPRARFDGAVLAGGSSTRMGIDKALIEIDGLALVSRVGRALRESGAVSVVGIGRAHGPEPHIDRWVDDKWPAQGPLGGIITALHATRCELVAVVACDIPHASSTEIANIVERVGTADAALSVVDGRDQPLHAVWHRRSLAHLAAAFAAAVRSVQGAIDGLDIVRVEPLNARSVCDVDTPEALRSHLDGR